MASTRKPSIDPVRWQPPPVDELPPLPAPQLTVVPVPGHAPEDVVVDAEGRLYTGVDDGRILRLSPSGGEATVIANTGGRPLGLEVARDGRLLICDSPRGLLVLDAGTGTLEPLVETVDGRHLQFCSNVTETPDGALYFTESTSAFTYEHFKGAVLESRARGGLFRRDPDGSVTTLADGLYFTNGVTVTADGSALVFAETLGRRLSKYRLTGPRAGTITPLVQHLPGHPDNMSTGADGRIWVAMVSPPNAAAEWLAPRPPVLRKLMWLLPDRFAPQIAPEVWAVAFDPDSGEAVAGLRTTHPDFGMVTGLVESDGRLWLACIGASALAHVALDDVTLR
ncbi:SMP-30/gluconolactonase/LRE family protein [Mycolicibacterium litorale]|uniref:Strictosidine synthase family protein n=1 Tax=Mycolicibacterium litorale TaxID=758802 RepID=A0AAD1MU94_9MYCO|nr:SMP-30/gluconolactonase/LRE family protein [Mycolicibacterium litorale]MCV7416158.1 SMP-30/gluconolactonase/LRE family protein [Mycolicibacterium litorale]TDY09409.1 sugar lactone lactonase YvrE [Mycolicibacterium litorale]BBY17355.1 strictosidine synthase family protein [Mycolicibacterium litorale]